jgi:glutamine amidotransferase-like uncharacterized protein
MKLFLSIFTFILTCNAKEIKVLCYSGPGAGMSNPDVTNQIMCMNKGLVDGVTFSSKRSETLHASDLEGYDVILAPGGEIGYDRYGEFDQSAVRAFVKAGGGYYGTCAGAYAGCLRTEADETGLINPSTGERVNATGFNETTGKPIYPSRRETGLTQAVCHTFWHVATADFAFTSKGQSILKQPSKVEIDHHNGPTMDCHGSTCDMIATFASTQQRGSGAMLTDKYGSGNVILISPHPEHDKDQNCQIVARAAAYAGGAITKEQLTQW